MLLNNLTIHVTNYNAITQQEKIETTEFMLRYYLCLCAVDLTNSLCEELKFE